MSEKEKLMLGGLLGNLLAGTPLGTLGVMPFIKENELVIEVTEEQLKAMLLQGADPKYRDFVTVKVLDGKIVIKVRLF